MKRNILSLFIIFLFAACSQQDPGEKLKFVDGYWEIKKVELSKDSVKEYGFNQSIDFIELENGKGFRKKVRPQLDGSYQITDDAEKVEAKIEEGELNLYYSTPFDSWEEEVLEAGEEDLKIKTESGMIYHYKRYKPLINYNEKE